MSAVLCGMRDRGGRDEGICCSCDVVYNVLWTVYCWLCADELAAYFGIFPKDMKFWAERGYDYSANQVRLLPVSTTATCM